MSLNKLWVSVSILTKLFQTTWCKVGVITSVQLLEGPPPKIWDGQKRPNFGAISDNFRLCSRISSELIDISPTGTGPPKKINRVNLKFGLKLSVRASITSGLVGISSPKFYRRHGELWSTNEKRMGTDIDTLEVLVHCNLTQFHMPRGSTVQFSGSFGRWSCWERNFE